MREGVVILVFSVLALLPFLLRPTLYGFDPYYFMDQAGLQLWTVKLIVFGVLLLSNLFLVRIARHFTSRPLWALVFAFSTPAWVVYLFKFEDDLLALPFLLLSLDYMLWGKRWHALASTIVAGIIFKGALVWAVVYAFFFYGFWPIVAGAFLFFPGGMWNLLPTFTVSESLPFVNSVYWFMLWIVPLFFLKKWRLGQLKRADRPQKLLFLFICFGILNGKFVAFAVPLLAAYLAMIWNGLDSKRQLLLIFFTVFFVGHTMLDIYSGPPSAEDLALIRAGITRADGLGEPFKNTWPVGYWVEHVSPGRSTARAGGVWNQDFNGATVATHPERWWAMPGCRALHRTDNVHLWDC